MLSLGKGGLKWRSLLPPECFRTVDTLFNINVVHKILIVHVLSSAFVAFTFEGALW